MNILAISTFSIAEALLIQGRHDCRNVCSIASCPNIFKVWIKLWVASDGTMVSSIRLLDESRPEANERIHHCTEVSGFIAMVVG